MSDIKTVAWKHLSSQIVKSLHFCYFFFLRLALVTYTRIQCPYILGDENECT